LILYKIKQKIIREISIEIYFCKMVSDLKGNFEAKFKVHKNSFCVYREVERIAMGCRGRRRHASVGW
jgi:hypothetical protein